MRFKILRLMIAGNVILMLSDVMTMTTFRESCFTLSLVSGELQVCSRGHTLAAVPVGHVLITVHLRLWTSGVWPAGDC